MKLLQGKETIAKFNERYLTVNWDYLASEVGERKEREEFEKAIGFLFRIVSIGLILASLIYPLLVRENWIINNFILLNNPVGWFFTLGLVFFVYSFYLFQRALDHILFTS